jgi:NAD(P)-dependent dehydrogenase (short-subunit alcohol dehydrogenase family)
MTTIKELKNLSGRRALITGAAGTLGQIFAETLSELGADLLLVDLPNTSVGILADKIKKVQGVSVDTFICDLENEEARLDLLEFIKKSRFELNVLVNNAAFVDTSNLEGWNVPFERQKLETWRRALEVNLTSVFDLCQGLYANMKNATGASIINVTSIYGSYGPDWRIYEGTHMNNPAAYAASKGGLTQLTRWLSTTMAPDVRVNAISPGGIYKQQDPSFVTKYELRTPLARMATPDDLKGALAFLATDLSLYVTGHILEVNGGWGVW